MASRFAACFIRLETRRGRPLTTQGAAIAVLRSAAFAPIVATLMRRGRPSHQSHVLFAMLRDGTFCQPTPAPNT